jgi:hypothetical protein
MSRAQRERDAKAYWDSRTLEQEAWVLCKMRLRHPRDDDPIRYDRAAVRCVALLLGQDRSLHLGDLRDLADLLLGVGHSNQVAQLRLERWLRARGCSAKRPPGSRRRPWLGRVSPDRKDRGDELGNKGDGDEPLHERSVSCLRQCGRPPRG